MSDTDYNRRLGNKITFNYKKCESSVKHRIDKETEKKLNRLTIVKTWNVTLGTLTFLPLTITNQTLEIAPNTD